MVGFVHNKTRDARVSGDFCRHIGDKGYWFELTPPQRNTCSCFQLTRVSGDFCRGIGDRGNDLS